MRWVQALRATLQSWMVTATLAVGSLIPVVPWRGVTDLGGWLGGMLDVLGVGAIVGLSVVMTPTIGLALAWLFIGHLSYKYTHLLYPAEYEAVVDYDGFRLLTALGTLYFGIIFWGTIMPVAVPVQVLPGSDASQTLGLALLTLVAGFVGGGLVFGLYLARWHPQKLYSEESDLTALFQTYFPSDDDPEALSGKWQSFYRWQAAATYPMVLPAICALVGLVAVIANLFYPLPEAVFLAGLVAFRLRPETGSKRVHVPQYEVDLRLLDAISGAFRNLKGIFMIMFSGLGSVLSGLTFFVFVGGLVTILSQAGGIDGESSAVGAWLIALVVLALVMLLLAVAMMGVYSLIHWVRQLERVEPYARQWGDTEGDREAKDVDEDTLATRPPGLLLPAHLPLAGLSLTVGVLTATESRLVFFGVLVGSTTVAVIVMGGGLIWTRRHRHDPQPLTHESRDLLVTLLLQLGAITGIGIFDLETLQIQSENLLFGVFGLLIVTAGFYLPDIVDWQSRQEGIWKLLGDAPVVMLIILLMAFVWGFIEGNTIMIDSILLGVLAVVIISTFVDIYLDRIRE